MGAVPWLADLGVLISDTVGDQNVLATVDGFTKKFQSPNVGQSWSALQAGTPAVPYMQLVDSYTDEFAPGFGSPLFLNSPVLLRSTRLVVATQQKAAGYSFYRDQDVLAYFETLADPYNGAAAGTVNATPDITIGNRSVVSGQGVALAFSMQSGAVTTGKSFLEVGFQINFKRTGGNSKGQADFAVKTTTVAGAPLTIALSLLDNGRVSVPNTSNASSINNGALMVAGGIAVAGISYISNGAILDNNGVHMSFGTSDDDPGIHINRPNRNSAGTVGGIVLSQGIVPDRRLYLTGNDGTFSFHIGSYATVIGELQLSSNEVGVAALFSLGIEDNKVVTGGSDANASFRAHASSDAPTFSAQSDTSAYDTYFRTQRGGAHISNNPRGGDLILTFGDGGSGGSGRAGKLYINGVIRYALLSVGSSTTLSVTQVFVRQTAGGITTTLWPSPQTGDSVSIRNAGGGAANTINGNGNTIDGAATFNLNDGEAATFVYAGGGAWVTF